MMALGAESESYGDNMKNPHFQQVPREWQEFMGIIGSGLKFVLEIGIFVGKGTEHLCKVSEKVIALDIGDNRMFKPKNSIFIEADSHSEEALKKVKDILGDNKLDVLFIDGDHTYEGAKKDFELYSGLVKGGGVIGLHDIVDSPKHRRRNCYVSKFWKEIKGKYKSKELIYDGSWAGIGVIWK